MLSTARLAEFYPGELRCLCACVLQFRGRETNFMQYIISANENQILPPTTNKTYYAGGVLNCFVAWLSFAADVRLGNDSDFQVTTVLRNIVALPLLHDLALYINDVCHNVLFANFGENSHLMEMLKGKQSRKF